VRLPHERFDYSAIVDRTRWRLPKGARIAVWTIVNVEEWDIEKPMARQYLTAPQGVATVPDVPNWACTTTACAWASGGCTRRSSGARSARRPRSTPASVTPIRAWPRRCATRAGSSWGTASSRAPCTCSPISARSSATRSNHREIHGPEAEGLARTRAHRDVGDARSAGRGRHRVRLGLGQRRSALRDSAPRTARSCRCPTRSSSTTSRPWSSSTTSRPRGCSAAATSSTGSTTRGRRTRASWRSPLHPYIHGVPHRIRYFEEVYDYVRRKKGVWMTTGAEIYEWWKSGRR